MNDRPSLESIADDWSWLESLPYPAIVFPIEYGSLAAVNNLACEMAGMNRADFLKLPVSDFIPEYLMSSEPLLAEWRSTSDSGDRRTLSLDLLLEIPGIEPHRVTGRIGPVDTTGEYLIAVFETAENEFREITDDEAIATLLTDIGRIIGASLDLRDVCAQVATSLAQVIRAEHVAFLLSTDQEDTFDAAYVTGSEKRFEVSAPVPGSSISSSIETHEVAVLSPAEIAATLELNTDARNYVRKSLKSLCSVPLVNRNEFIGLLLFGSIEPRQFTTDDLSLVEQIGRHVAGAISNVALHEKLSVESNERHALANIGRLASSSIDFAAVLPEIIADISEIMPVVEIVIFEPSEASVELAQTHSWQDSSIPSTVRWSEPEIEHAIKRSITESSPISLILSSNICVLAAPMNVGANTVGVMAVAKPEGDDFNARELSFTSRLADQLAGSVLISRMHRRRQREAKLRRALADLSLAISKDTSTERILERLAEEIATLIEYDLISIALVEPDRSKLTPRFQLGTDRILKVHQPLDLKEDSTPAEPRMRAFDDLENEPGMEALSASGFESFLEAPIGSEGSPTIGYLALASRERDKFTSHEAESLQMAAAQVAPFIQNSMAQEQAMALAEAKSSEANAEARSRELERISEAKSKFLSIVSHELRTPLTSIIAYAELLERNTSGNLGEKQQTQARVIARSADHLKFLIGDLLDMSRMDSGNFALTMANFDLTELGDELVESFIPVLAEKNQSLKKRISHERLYLHGDRSRIAQLISNVLENASKYSPADTDITLDIHRTKDEVIISVIDEGIGISEEDQSQLFTPFFRANSELTRTEPGTGLGLSLVKKIAELHQGEVRLKSEPGSGSTFSVTFKARTDSQAA